MSARKIWTLVAVWVAVVLACFGLVIYGLEPMFTARQQSDLLESYRADIAHATAEAQGLPGVSTPTKAVEYGSPVGIMEVNALHLQQVVVEGAGVSQT